MATENFIRDLSGYLIPGNLSDLTLTFGEKSWQIHKALACSHSKWFQKAVTIGFEETKSGVITLNDDPDFANAIECMVSYFYKADYDVSQYDTSESLLHAQIATIADKYDCASLYKLARASFANTVNALKSDDWVAVAAFIYDHTITELPAHEELRGLVVAAVANRPVLLSSILQLEGTTELLRSTADLATDLLLSGLHTPKVKDVAEHMFICNDCHYAHAGSRDCSYVASQNILMDENVCPECGNDIPEVMSRRYRLRVYLAQAFPCPSCNGIHTKECT
ncbi:hypothetical protein GQ44DRAFT_699808 [Phaeosphaeriaceae sp. PMI808]|nr:hypothetical protein GQ44DRAFT_699808 [Phaeosphaeriaceae sp. PMI808]